MDTVEAALQKPSGPGTGKPRGHYRKRQLIDIAVDQLLMARDVQGLLRQVINKAKKDAQTDKKDAAAELLDPAWLREFNALTKTITNATEQIRRSRKDEREAMGGLSKEQLDDVLRQHLPRLVRGFAPADWKALLVPSIGAELADRVLALLFPEPQAVTP